MLNATEKYGDVWIEYPGHYVADYGAGNEIKLLLEANGFKTSIKKVGRWITFEILCIQFKDLDKAVKFIEEFKELPAEVSEKILSDLKSKKVDSK